MKKFLVVHQKNLPTRIPVSATLLIILALDHWNAPTWLWIIAMVITFIRWGIVAIRVTTENQFDLFPGSLKQVEEAERKFTERFRDIIRNSAR